MIYIIRVNGKERIFEMTTTLQHLYAVVSVFEKQELEFKVICSAGVCTQFEFGSEYMKYWVTKFSR